MRKGKMRILTISIIMILALMINLFSPLTFSLATPKSDIEGHWAQQKIETWKKIGFAKGYTDGTFKPNKSVTRAEFVALVNRSFGFSEQIETNYKDVSNKDWFYEEINKAQAAGYITGYNDGTFRPNQPISRQEVAIILSRLLDLKSTSGWKNADTFIDSKEIPKWSKGAIDAVVSQGYMKGYPDKSFKPQNPITRAEAIVSLDRALNLVVFEKAGTYGSEKQETLDGNVVIASDGVTLQNLTINGNLFIAEAIGEGNAFLKNVKVNGTTFVYGGGSNSIHFEDSILVTVIVNKRNGDVRIVAEGTTSVQQVTLHSGARLQEENLEGTGFTNVSITDALPAGSKVTLEGTFETVDVIATSISVDIPHG